MGQMMSARIAEMAAAGSGSRILRVGEVESETPAQVVIPEPELNLFPWLIEFSARSVPTFGQD
jgi:hypothetical protein